MQKYTVKPGDSLSGIARKFYGDPQAYPRISKANGITDPNDIHVGQTLSIPTAETNTQTRPDTQGSGLTDEQLRAIMPYASQSNRQRYLLALNHTMAKYRINTQLRRAHFLAQIAHESGSLHYCEEIANGEAYEGRRDLGNVQPGDGPRYKGRGLIQLTGRANYQAYGDSLGIDLISEPEPVAQDPELAADVAGWFWDRHDLNALADNDDIRKITKKINGGYNGLDDRISYYDKASHEQLA